LINSKNIEEAQNLVAATESYIRIIPPPIGDMLANTFLEGNRAVAKIDEKRIRLGNDISNGLGQISQLASTASTAMKEGFESLAKQTREAASNSKNSVQEATIPVATTGGFHRRTRRKSWRTKTRRTSEKH
jgi:ElaB/YqjD/DUF883 family membrane-anchored ribosome-binding protein